MGAIVASYIHSPPHTPGAAQDYINGLHAALAVSAAISFGAAIVAVVLVRTRPQVERSHVLEMAA
jgi:hypothetical protein